MRGGEGERGREEERETEASQYFEIVKMKTYRLEVSLIMPFERLVSPVYCLLVYVIVAAHKYVFKPQLTNKQSIRDVNQLNTQNPGWNRSHPMHEVS